MKPKFVDDESGLFQPMEINDERPDDTVEDEEVEEEEGSVQPLEALEDGTQLSRENLLVQEGCSICISVERTK